MVTVPRIEAEIAAVQAKIEELNKDLEAAHRWLGELTTSLGVLQKLADADTTSKIPPTAKPRMAGNFVSGSMAITTSVSRRSRTDIVERAGQALVHMLTERGDHIKQREAVRLLRERYDILVGNGVPGRETSDLSAALGNGKFPPLVVTRIDGWGLTTWNGGSPREREAVGANPVAELTPEERDAIERKRTERHIELVLSDDDETVEEPHQAAIEE